MKGINLLVRCYARKRNDQWEAFCIDLCLAAQGDSFSDVKSRLERQISSYVHEALTVDREYAEQLLTRRAPLKMLLTYYAYLAAYKVNAIRNGFMKVFTEALPVDVGTARTA